MKIIILLCVCIAVALACSCAPQSANSAYCEADWVSRVEVAYRYDPQPDENSGGHDVIYLVVNIRTYKKPSNDSDLSIAIYTPSQGATCGVDLTVGKQYLLSGNKEPDGSLHSYLCGQVNDDGGTYPSEWREISRELRSNLTEFGC